MFGVINKQSDKKPKVPTKPKTYQELEEKEPVSVFCRIRPTETDQNDGFAIVINSKTLKLVPPVTSFASRSSNAKEQSFEFKNIFPANSSQKDVFDHVAKPLIDDLLNGKNGLLFVYGITGSGKTYTMEGTRSNGGILSRTVDIIFNTIGEYQTMKFIFKPDRMNGFEIQSETDALIDKQKFDMMSSLSRVKKSNRREQNSSQESLNRIPDYSRILNIDEDNAYCVFVNYIEIYNNYIYDLLEEFSDTNMIKDLQSKILREGARHNMYVHGCTEVEVKTPDEALEVLAKGQKRRKVAHTNLNCESSRSHSIFNIKVVQAPHDAQGERIVAVKSAVLVSQLSMVDLAGSERNNRTKATGERIKEAGSINNTLMALRQCIEALRDNQQNRVSRKVPYRESKLTHYFKNYFEGEGKIKMIVCVNPSSENYNETLPVMKFAELASEVKVNLPDSTFKPDFGFTPGRRKANQVLKEVQQRLDEEGIESEELDTVNIGSVYSLGLPYPSIAFSTKEEFEEVTQKLKFYLMNAVEVKRKLIMELDKKGKNLREGIKQIEEENFVLQQENESLKAQVKFYKTKLANSDTFNDTSWDDYNLACEERNSKLQGHVDKKRLKKRKTKLEVDIEKLSKEINKLKEQKNELKNKFLPVHVKTLQGKIEETPKSLRHQSSSSVEDEMTDLNKKIKNLPARNIPKRKRSLSQGDNIGRACLHPKSERENSFPTTPGGVRIVIEDMEARNKTSEFEPSLKRGLDGIWKEDRTSPPKQFRLHANSAFIPKSSKKIKN